MSRIYVVRHGEASWHAEDYDQLTDKGHAQARAVGAELAARGIRPDVVVSGTLRRHRETAAGLLEGAGWDHAVAEDDRWNELDADDIVRAHAPEHATMTAALAHFAGRGAAGRPESSPSKAPSLRGSGSGQDRPRSARWCMRPRKNGRSFFSTRFS